MKSSAITSLDTLLPLLERAFEGVLIIEADSLRIVYANPAVCGWLGLDAAELTRRTITALFDSESQAAVNDAMARVRSSEPGNDSVVLRLSQDERAVAARFCRIEFERQSLVGILIQEAADSQRTDRAAQKRRDPLTGLLDRDYLYLRLTQLMASAQGEEQSFGALFVDLNNFKEINDRNGHLIGDQVLREAARRLATCVRGVDQVIRYGGDEFVVLLEQLGKNFEIDELVRRIQIALAQPITLPEGDVMLSASVGMAVAGPEHRTPEELLAAADRAMYEAKRGKP